MIENSYAQEYPQNFYILQVENFKKILPEEDLIKQIIKAKKYIDNHYTENIDLDKIACESAFSKFHFLRLFKNIYGRTPYQYLKSTRIDNAKKLLKNGETIKNTCFYVGFESITSFNALFKRSTGLTPALFQKKYSKDSNFQ